MVQKLNHPTSPVAKLEVQELRCLSAANTAASSAPGAA